MYFWRYLWGFECLVLGVLISRGAKIWNYLVLIISHQTPRLVAQREFISALISVGKRLTSLPTKDLKSKYITVYFTF